MLHAWETMLRWPTRIGSGDRTIHHIDDQPSLARNNWKILHQKELQVCPNFDAWIFWQKHKRLMDLIKKDAFRQVCAKCQDQPIPDRPSGLGIDSWPQYCSFQMIHSACSVWSCVWDIPGGLLGLQYAGSVHYQYLRLVMEVADVTQSLAMLCTHVVILITWIPATPIVWCWDIRSKLQVVRPLDFKCNNYSLL